uniref:Uncharacterized protein n=1 Tax=Rhizophora mucronata TaxID=61149 RepID=A0A2P2NPD7_RHIMU
MDQDQKQEITPFLIPLHGLKTSHSDCVERLLIIVAFFYIWIMNHMPEYLFYPLINGC